MYSHFNNEPVAKRVNNLFTDRLRQFTSDGEYRSLNLPAFYERERLDGKNHVAIETYAVSDLRRPLFKDALKEADGHWKPAKKGSEYGPSWATHWFKIQVCVPPEWKKNYYKKGDLVVFNWNLNCEGLVFSESGEALIGLSGEERREWPIPDNWFDGKCHTFYIEASCNGMFGNATGSSIQPPSDNRYFRLDSADLVVINSEARHLFVDFWIIGDAAREFPGDSWQRGKALDVANKIMDAFDPENPDESIAEGRKLAKEYLGDTTKAYKQQLPFADGLVYALGNCHIDTAWLWPFAETRRKAGRSWASQLELIDKYPEYVFVASQAQQFKWLKEDYPDLFAKIQKQAKKGRFLPVGGAWTECDTNLPSGESLLRQFLLGQRFFLEHFGSLSDTFWLPDTFGYSAQVPQLCRLAGMDRFLTQKLSWNNINSFPNSTFNWVALDGSQVLCHMPPNNTYTSMANFGDVSRTQKQNKNLDTTRNSLMLYGHGDGGGGPTAEMLEKLRRCRGVSNTVGELPPVIQGQSVTDFYNELLDQTNNGKDLVTWVGELYFEFHRGTYTSQAQTKKGNRVSENLLHDVELLATLASIRDSSYKYPFAQLESLWEDVCLCQFHDVLPGSCIEMVYKDVKKIHGRVIDTASHLIDKAASALGLSGHPSKDSFDCTPVALNTMPWSRTEVVAVPQPHWDATVELAEGVEIQEDSGNALVMMSESGPVVTTQSVDLFKSEDAYILENSQVKVTICKDDGTLTSIYDKENDRRVLSGTGNRLVLFDDQPLSWQAWDTEVFSLGKKQYIGAENVTRHSIVSSGPLRSTVAFTYEFNKSVVTTEISLDANSPLVTFNTRADWHETCKFLKVEFPVDVHSESASYESQFGVVKRPTHYNTSWDVAKFEVCCHKFADLSELDYGVSILNDCKYGFATHGNLMRLSLLRAPKAPDAHADMGHHEFKYGVLAHKGPLGATTVRAAYNFNNPLRVKYVGLSEVSTKQAFSLKGPANLVLSQVKRAEVDRSKKSTNVILRVYEALGGRTRGKLVIDLPNVVSVTKTCALEYSKEKQVVAKSEGVTSVDISLRAFEVATYKVELA
ncbi:galactose mutarotase-like domain-containing protein [Yarrowia lipolytica]|jgi:alpha-mannosidase|uniref:Alpha-mannosidase n=2 Tax=Yarrowia lipolytica TaxID=4952 RepID=Q6C883_YARLI|nr:YALI0D21890p [Yarrowia lipolytica CLIB122]AOW04433.1 hypothetical protein YALI1_D27637g [Yarrowia lipolytica]KAB8285748.1 galactose mutarotase-like domain-containing protein [Yarrowia lipolytica]KAE8172355.1 galactose mutarotase-like domain-containing protein [Yarrowia lipolytica]KAJ8054089.1 galactose mutarotase-like domain-containing protein [Yarrowia lipolytica]RDW26163.1 galactose mutarotase-like domain-containing protein [Yarrowia lipolytica]|eukprot:XP_503129.1 YALI0D21890p [Yarrowia lipolytica CLIB122]